MVIKGKPCGGAKRLATHLLRTDTNERVDVIELRGVGAESLAGALREFEAVASGTRTTKPFYHSQINTRAEERLTDEQRLRAIDRLEAELGLTGQPRAVVVHEKADREHCHIVWSRIDLDRMAAISDSHNYRKHEIVARELEREFGHERVQGAHIEREGKQRPARTPSHAEMLQADRTGLTPQEVKEHVTKLWRENENGPDFVMALWRSGYVLARGDRRDFVIIDPRGGTHSLSRRIDGATAKDIRERLVDIEPHKIPNVREAKEIQQTPQRRDLAASLSEEAVRRDEEDRGKRRSESVDMDWTSKGGMVAQQRSAMDWAEKAQAEKAARTEQTDQRAASEATDASQRRKQALLREFGKDIQEERESEWDRGRERDRREE